MENAYLEVAPNHSNTKDYTIAFGRMTSLKSTTNRASRQLNSQDKKDDSKTYKTKQPLSRKNLPHSNGVIDIAGEPATSRKLRGPPQKKIDLQKPEKQLKINQMPKRNLNPIKKRPSKEKPHSHLTQNRNVQRVEIFNTAPDFKQVLEVPPSLATTRPIPTLGLIYGDSILSNDIYNDYFLDARNENHNDYNHPDSSTVPDITCPVNAICGNNNASEDQNKSSIISLKYGNKAFKTTNDNIKDWLTSELEKPTRDNESGYHSTSPPRQSDDKNKSNTPKDTKADIIRKYSLLFKKRRENKKSVSTTDISKKSSGSNSVKQKSTTLKNQFPLPKMNTETKMLRPSNPVFYTTYKFPSTPNPTHNQEYSASAGVPSYVECPSEVLQRTTNFETEGRETPSTVNGKEDFRDDLSSHAACEHLDDFSETTDLCDWILPSSQCSAVFKTSKESNTTLSSWRGRRDNLSSDFSMFKYPENCSYHEYFYHYCWRKEGAGRDIDRQQIRDCLGRCKKCQKYRRHPNNRDKIRMMHYLQRYHWDNADVQTTLLVYHETGTDAVAKNQKSANIATECSEPSKPKETGPQTISQASSPQKSKIIPDVIKLKEIANVITNSKNTGTEVTESVFLSTSDVTNTPSYLNEALQQCICKPMLVACHNAATDIQFIPQEPATTMPNYCASDITNSYINTPVSETNSTLHPGPIKAPIIFTSVNTETPKSPSECTLKAPAIFTSPAKETPTASSICASETSHEAPVSPMAISLVQPTATRLIAPLTVSPLNDSLNTIIPLTIVPKILTPTAVTHEICDDSVSTNTHIIGTNKTASVKAETTISPRFNPETLHLPPIITSSGNVSDPNISANLVPRASINKTSAITVVLDRPRLTVGNDQDTVTSAGKDSDPVTSASLVPRSVTPKNERSAPTSVTWNQSGSIDKQNIDTILPCRRLENKGLTKLTTPKGTVLSCAGLDVTPEEIKKTTSTSVTNFENDLFCDMAVSTTKLINTASFNCGSPLAQCSFNADVHPTMSSVSTNTDEARSEPIVLANVNLTNDKLRNTTETCVQYSNKGKDDSLGSGRIGHSRLMSVRMLGDSVSDMGTQVQPLLNDAETRTIPKGLNSASVLTSHFLLADHLQKVKEENGDSTIKDGAIGKKETARLEEAPQEPNSSKAPVKMEGQTHEPEKPSRVVEPRHPSVVISSNLNATKWMNGCAKEDYQSIIDISEMTVSESLERATLAVATSNAFKTSEGQNANQGAAINCVTAKPIGVISDVNLADAIPVRDVDGQDIVKVDQQIAEIVEEPNIVSGVNVKLPILVKRKSVAVLTSRYLLTQPIQCHKETSECLYVYERARCVVHNQRTDASVQIKSTHLAIGENSRENKWTRDDVAVDLAMSIVKAGDYKEVDNLAEAVSPRVYKTLYETSRLIAKERSLSKEIENVGNKTDKNDLLEEQLTTSCRYYSKLLTKNITRMKESFKKRLPIPVYRAATSQKYIEAFTMKPSGRQDVKCQAKIDFNSSDNCLLTPAASAIDIRGGRQS
ncbi:unnamed protein product [Leptosia nina]|uniref:Uncharacterized protein n=1 Tax=Leptosia nina TaxID=320188 RepID=A0AAV1JV31_9NEOP